MLPEEYFIILEHLENLTILTLIMSEIRSSYTTNESQRNELSHLAEVLLQFDDWTIIVRISQQRFERFGQFRSTTLLGRASNQLQERINAFMHCGHCQRRYERQFVAVEAVCLVTLNYGHCDTATRNSPTEWPLRVTAT